LRLRSRTLRLLSLSLATCCLHDTGSHQHRINWPLLLSRDSNSGLPFAHRTRMF